MKTRFDLRVWGPALVALACFVPRALPEAAAVGGEAARSIELPEMRVPPPKPRTQVFELDPERSSVRLLVQDRSGERLAQCTRVGGELELGDDRTDGELRLVLDLASLQDLGEAVHGAPSLPDVLGALGARDVELRARLVAVELGDLPGVQHDSWDGTVRLDERVHRQPLSLWRSALPGARLRLQGQTTIAAADFGLAPRAWLGIFEQRIDVTLGLDLAWRRRRGN